MNHVWKHADVTGSELLVLLALADYAGDNNICWPSLNSIGQKARISRRHVIRILGQLVDKGLIEIVQAGGVIDGMNRANVYRIRPDSMSPPGDTTSLPGDTMSRGSDAHVTTGGDTHVTTVVTPMSPQSSYNHHKQPSDSNTSSTLTPQQEIFGAVCAAIGWDANTLTADDRGQIAQAAGVLKKAGYEADDVRRFMRDVWAHDWRFEKKGQPPTLRQLRQEIGKLRKGQNNGTHQSDDRDDDEELDPAIVAALAAKRAEAAGISVQ